MSIPVSLHIPSYNRHDVLVDTLRGCLSQNYRPLEIVVFDQSLEHPLPVTEFLRAHRDRLKLVQGAPHGAVHAYRQCLAHSTGEICVFVDDDVLISDPDFIAKHVAALDLPGVGAVCGQVLHAADEVPTHPAPRMLTSRYPWLYVRFNLGDTVEDIPSLAAANMSFRRSVYEEAGGFDLNYRAHGFRFETDFSLAVRRAGYKIRFEPAISLVHRYGTPGGADNAWLGSLDDRSRDWYRDFFANTWYFLRKWYKPPARAFPAWAVFREHVLNGTILRRKGPRFMLQRAGMFMRAGFTRPSMAR